MLFIFLTIAKKRYAIPANTIVEVLPHLIEPNRNNATENGYFAGLIDYRGKVLPVIDLCTLHQNRPCRRRLSSRIIVINYPPGQEGGRLLGLLAEKVNEAVNIELGSWNKDISTSGLTLHRHSDSPSRSEMVTVYDFNLLLSEKIKMIIALE